jgi:CRISPR type IV-associated protein Csf2
MKNLRSGKIETLYTLLSPLSHIGSSIGPDSYLNTMSVISADGEPTDVFVYSGNAIRGALRDAGARYMMDRLGDPEVTLQLPLEVFYLLFSGGSIGGESKIDIDQARRIREAVPHLSVLGGGVGNQILPGKVNVGEALPVCREFSHILPTNLAGAEYSWRAMTTERSFTRTDDAKNELLTPYIRDAGIPGLAPREQAGLEVSDEPPKNEKENKHDKPQQMRYTIELLSAGTRLWSIIDYFDMTDIELGALVAAIDEWAKRPVLGGQARIGMGRVKAEMSTYDGPKPEEPFITIDPRGTHLHEAAAEPKSKYDEFLATYRRYLQLQSGEIIRGLNAKAGA